MNEAYTWTYDVGGNILEKCTYCLASNGSIGSCQKQDIYTYASTGWKDQLTSYNGQSITYDALGNPTTYRGNTLTWSHVRRLASYGSNTYTYDAAGIRTSKTVGGVKHTYTLDGNKILREKYGNTTLTFYYGISGVIGFNYNGLDFYYRKNLQGDVIAIYSACGMLAATYAYDAWGNIIAGADYSGMGIDAINPIRYRSYYYDVETGLYYLQSRYYDPETGRFINADDTQYLEPEVLGGINLYAYCGNNPVMGYDPIGKFTLIALLGGIAFGTLIGAIAGGINAIATEGDFVAGVVSGATSGLISAVGTAFAITTGGLGGLAIAGLTGYAAGFSESVVQQGLTDGFENIDSGKAIISGRISAVSNMISFGFSNAAVRESVGLFEEVLDKSIPYLRRVGEALSISAESVMLTMCISVPLTITNSLSGYAIYSD